MTGHPVTPLVHNAATVARRGDGHEKTCVWSLDPGVRTMPGADTSPACDVISPMKTGRPRGDLHRRRVTRDTHPVTRNPRRHALLPAATADRVVGRFDRTCGQSACVPGRNGGERRDDA